MRISLLQSDPRSCPLSFESGEFTVRPIPEEPESETTERDMEDCYHLLYNLDVPDEQRVSV
jgi:hypothetical protein